MTKKSMAAYNMSAVCRNKFNDEIKLPKRENVLCCIMFRVSSLELMLPSNGQLLYCEQIRWLGAKCQLPIKLPIWKWRRRRRRRCKQQQNNSFSLARLTSNMYRLSSIVNAYSFFWPKTMASVADGSKFKMYENAERWSRMLQIALVLAKNSFSHGLRRI